MFGQRSCRVAQAIFLSGLLFQLHTGASRIGATAAPSSAPIQVEWRVNKQEADELKAKFNVAESDGYDTKHPVVIGVIILVGSFVAPQIIDALLDIWQKHRNDGFLLDTRGDKLVIEKSARIPAGNIVIVSKDGVETKHVGGPNPDPKILNDILERFIKK